MGVVKLKIETKREWLELYWELWKGGLLRDIKVQDMNLSEECFPIEIPIQLDKIEKAITNPLMKPYKRRIDTVLHDQLENIIG